MFSPKKQKALRLEDDEYDDELDDGFNGTADRSEGGGGKDGGGAEGKADGGDGEGGKKEEETGGAGGAGTEGGRDFRNPRRGGRRHGQIKTFRVRE